MELIFIEVVEGILPVLLCVGVSFLLAKIHRQADWKRAAFGVRFPNLPCQKVTGSSSATPGKVCAWVSNKLRSAENDHHLCLQQLE